MTKVKTYQKDRPESTTYGEIEAFQFFRYMSCLYIVVISCGDKFAVNLTRQRVDSFRDGELVEPVEWVDINYGYNKELQYEQRNSN